MPRKQLNIGLRPEDYEQVLAAAEEAGQDVTGFCRGVILAAAVPSPVEPEPAASNGVGGAARRVLLVARPTLHRSLAPGPGAASGPALVAAVAALAPRAPPAAAARAGSGRRG